MLGCLTVLPHTTCAYYLPSLTKGTIRDSYKFNKESPGCPTLYFTSLNEEVVSLCPYLIDLCQTGSVLLWLYEELLSSLRPS